MYTNRSTLPPPPPPPVTLLDTVELPPCPDCGGDLYHLGVLGFLLHSRCRHCGSTVTLNLSPR